MKNILLLAIPIIAFFSCKNSVDSVSLKDFAITAQKYDSIIDGFEVKIDPTNIETFMQMNDSATKYRNLADTVLTKDFAKCTDTIILKFEQTQNLDKLQIKRVWVSGIHFNEVIISATVTALDNSAMFGPYTSLSAFTKEGTRLEVGGGIQGPVDVKLVAGQTYTFTGNIDNLNNLQDISILRFDEEIKKW